MRRSTAGGGSRVGVEAGQSSRWGRGARLTRPVREEAPPGELARGEPPPGELGRVGFATGR